MPRAPQRTPPPPLAPPSPSSPRPWRSPAPGVLTACGSGSGGDPDTVEISYKQSTDNQVRVMDTFLADVGEQFEKANPGKKVKLVPTKPRTRTSLNTRRWRSPSRRC